MNKYHGRRFALSLCTALFSCTAALGTGVAEGTNPVKVAVNEVGWFCTFNMSEDVWEENPAQLEIRLRLSTPDQEGFFSHVGSKRQYLDATDSTGRKLAPVEFDFTWLSRIQIGGKDYTSISGIVRDVPGPDASWLRLKGKFRMFLARIVKGDVYELPLMKGAEVPFSLPGADGEADAGSGYIATSGRMSENKLSLKEFRTFEKDGKKMICAEIQVKAEMPFDLDRIEVLNEKNEDLGVQFLGAGSSIGEDFIHINKEFQLVDPGNLHQFKVRLFYRTLKKEVSVPVDIKVGMTGEIREEI